MFRYYWLTISNYQDAAQILQLEPYANIEKKLSLKANKIFVEKDPVSHPPAPIEVNPVLGGKADFMFVDISKPDQPQISIREKTGALRNASSAEVYLKKNRKPKNFSM